MSVANSFDLWQKDAFFFAAEEVQQSADIMESSYRTWVRARREGWRPEGLDELSRELQMALATAKWQLEEFERAVRLSYRSHRDDITVSRHSQFVSALQDQISRVETALKESFQLEGKKAFHWVNLDDEECDDLALFLSGSSGTSHRITDVIKKKNSRKEDISVASEASSTTKIPIDGKSPQKEATTSEDANCSAEQEATKFLGTGNDIGFQAIRTASNHWMWSQSDWSSLEIVVDKDDRQYNAEIEATPKEKGMRPFFWNARGEDRLGVLSKLQTNLISWFNQVGFDIRSSAFERMPQKSETTHITSVALQLKALGDCFTTDHSFSSPIFGVFDLSNVESKKRSIRL